LGARQHWFQAFSTPWLSVAAMAATESHGVLNAWNQCWRAPNLLVVDGACWSSAGWQSPTLTEMAISWRACAAAAERLKQGDGARLEQRSVCTPG